MYPRRRPMPMVLAALAVLAVIPTACEKQAQTSASGGNSASAQAAASGGNAALVRPAPAEKSDVAAMIEAPKRMPQAAIASPQAALGAARAPGFFHLTPGPTPSEPGHFAEVHVNKPVAVAEQPVSTFSIDVDTASYALVRRLIENGQLPPMDAVRVEELVNAFAYDYPAPSDGSAPFKATARLMTTPWNPDTDLLHLGIQGWQAPKGGRPALNLVLLVDVSGSMQGTDRLPLLKMAFSQMVRETLAPTDRIAIVTYAGSTQVLLPSTPGSDQARILAAIDQLGAGGGTAGSEGLRLAYEQAQAGFDPKAVNRIILGTDGDFNLGLTDDRALEGFIADKRKTGIYLSILGVGVGNWNDRLMQRLAQAGNGNAAYIDRLAEARRVLIEEASGTLVPIADDVKIQVEFNPARIAEYRLIGYETRQLDRSDFSNDKVDAGEIGSGHRVTALYELVPVGSKARLLEPLRYVQLAAAASAGAKDNKAGEIAFLRLRYKKPGQSASQLIETPVTDQDWRGLGQKDSQELQFAAAVAGFGQLLRQDPALGSWGFDAVVELANPARGADLFGQRAEFVQLVRMAKALASARAPAQARN